MLITYNLCCLRHRAHTAASQCHGQCLQAVSRSGQSCLSHLDLDLDLDLDDIVSDQAAAILQSWVALIKNRLLNLTVNE